MAVWFLLHPRTASVLSSGILAAAAAGVETVWRKAAGRSQLVFIRKRRGYRIVRRSFQRQPGEAKRSHPLFQETGYEFSSFDAELTVDAQHRNNAKNISGEADRKSKRWYPISRDTWCLPFVQKRHKTGCHRHNSNNSIARVSYTKWKNYLQRSDSMKKQSHITIVFFIVVSFFFFQTLRYGPKPRKQWKRPKEIKRQRK